MPSPTSSVCGGSDLSSIFLKKLHSTQDSIILLRSPEATEQIWQVRRHLPCSLAQGTEHAPPHHCLFAYNFQKGVKVRLDTFQDMNISITDCTPVTATQGGTHLLSASS